MAQARNTISGITLIELLMTLAIIAVLAGMAMPMFGTFIGNTHARAARSQLAGVLNTARVGATSRARHVVVCPSSDQQTCSDSGLWHRGWVAFVDLNHDREIDVGEDTLVVGQALAPGTAIVGSSGRTRIDYQPDGSARGTNATLTVCERTLGSAGARTLVIGQSGRIRYGTASPEAAAQCLAAAG